MGYFRLALAALIAFQHLTPLEGKAAAIALWLFFALSGYTATFVLNEKYSSSKVFWAARVRRLYPQYLAVWLCSVAWASLYGSRLGTGTGELIPSLFMIDLAYQFTGVHSPVGVGWSITIILLFYGLLSLGVARSKPAVWWWLIASSLAYTVVNPWEWYYTPLFASLPFAVGGAAYWMKVRLPKPTTSWDRWCEALSYPVFLSHYLMGAIASTWLALPEGWTLFAISMSYAIAFSWALLEIEARIMNRVQTQFCKRSRQYLK